MEDGRGKREERKWSGEEGGRGKSLSGLGEEGRGKVYRDEKNRERDEVRRDEMR